MDGIHISKSYQLGKPHPSMKNIRAAKATFDDRDLASKPMPKERSQEIDRIGMPLLREAIEKSEREIGRLQKELAENMAKNNPKTAA